MARRHSTNETSVTTDGIPAEVTSGPESGAPLPETLPPGPTQPANAVRDRVAPDGAIPPHVDEEASDEDRQEAADRAAEQVDADGGMVGSIQTRPAPNRAVGRRGHLMKIGDHYVHPDQIVRMEDRGVRGLHVVTTAGEIDVPQKDVQAFHEQMGTQEPQEPQDDERSYVRSDADGARQPDAGAAE